MWSGWENRFNLYGSGDDNDPYIAMMLRDGATPPFNEAEFGELASRLYGPALEHATSHD